jgi:hypothetical protein
MRHLSVVGEVGNWAGKQVRRESSAVTRVHMELRDLGKAFAERSLKQALARAEAGDWDGLDALSELGLDIRCLRRNEAPLRVSTTGVQRHLAQGRWEVQVRRSAPRTGYSPKHLYSGRATQ